MDQKLNGILLQNNSDKTRLINILWDIQRQYGYISQEAVAQLSEALNLSPMDIAETISFYHFYRTKPFGEHPIYLCDSAIGRMNGYQAVRDTLEQEAATTFGTVSADMRFGLADTNCIGLSDQEPAMMVGDVVFTRLTPAKVASIMADLKAGKAPADIANPQGHDSSTLAYVESIVEAGIQNEGPVLFQPGRDYKALLQSGLDLHPDEIIDDVTISNIRGRGGAGFPTGLKWRLGREAEGAEKYIICNADEGEPGTFKDRVLLTRSPKDVLLGMIYGGYAIESRFGIIYLRAEYWYLKDYLERQIQDFRDEGLLGTNILGSGFEFDIRIQMGAGAYVCGDETSLIESCEGKRGTPRIKPPYPIQQGYLGMPTIVNNVETFACISRIIEKGGRWFADMGTEDSSGTRLLSVSGDCDRPGIYEIEWGMTLNEVLDMVGAQKPMAVQISGPSGECVSVAKDGDREICYSDLSCNGSFMIFDESRDLLDVVRQFMHFFVEESCGICTPCRAGGVDMRTKIERVIDGRACQQDLDECVEWGALMRATSRCGLGTTAAKPILTTLDKFPELYQAKLSEAKHSLLTSFDLEQAVGEHDHAFKALVEEASK
ncbi:MAG TPA: NADP oxidoreductase [Rhodobacteraceae bacterium]|nr:NADP oxidoreductase [Paracoccaceae bacterium]